VCTPKGKTSVGVKESVREGTSMANNWIQGAVKHPGALTAAARAHGVSKLQEAEKEAKSPNKHIAARGRLGERFIKKSV